MTRKILVFAAAVAVPAMAQVGVSVNVGEPGFFGQIDIGQAPPPAVIYPQPVVIQPAPGYVGGPLYLHVPPGHERHWAEHCAQYNACGRPVYFVRDDWYQREYVPRYHHQHGFDRDEGHRHEHDHDHGDDHGRDRHD